jgi:hypothetical protein
LLSLLLAIRIRQELPGELALKGGGMVRFVFGGMRFSKDLDYQCWTPTAPRVAGAIRRAFNKVTERLGFITDKSLKTVKSSASALTIKLSATCSDGMVLYSKVEISNRFGVHHPVSKYQVHRTVSERYGLALEHVDCLPAKVALTEKILALADADRMQARDIIDISLLSRSGVALTPSEFQETVTQRGLVARNILGRARANAHSPQMRRNFQEEVSRTLLVGTHNIHVFEDSLDEADALLRRLEDENAQ